MKKKYIPIYLGVGLLFSGILAGCGAAKPALLQITSSKSKGSTVTNSDSLSFSGKISGIQEVQILPKVSGNVLAINKDIGDKVKVGDVLIKIDTKELQDQLNSAQAAYSMAQAKYQDLKNGTRPEDIQAAKAAYDAALAKYQDVKNGARPEEIKIDQANLDAAQSAYNNAQTQLERTKNLFDQGVVSKSEYDDAQVGFQKAQTAFINAQNALKLAQEGATQQQLDALQAAVNAAKATYNKAVNGATPEELQQASDAVNQAQAISKLNQDNVDNGVITSPIDGYIASKNISVGELASPTIPLMTVVNIDQMYVSIDVPADKLKYIKPNEPVDVQVDSLSKTFKGTINNISPKAEPDTDKYLVKILVDNSDHVIRSGMTANVTITNK